MKKSKFGVRVLAMVLTMIMVLSLVPMSAWAAIHDITTGSYRGLVGVDTTSIGNNGEINWPVKIYDYQSDGMLFEYASSWLMDKEISDESTVAEKGGILYGGGEPMPVTKIGVDYTGNAAYKSNAYANINGIKNSAGVAIASNYALTKRSGPPQYLRLTAKNSAGTDNEGRANNFFIADFAVDQGGAVAKADARYMVMAYTARGLDVSTTPFSIFITSDSGHTTYKRGNLDSSYGITNGTSKWRYVVIDLQKVLSSHWSSIEKFYALGISVKLDYLSSNTDLLCLSHVAFFNNEAEAERYGQKAVAFDNNPGEYLGNLSTHKWNLGNNLAFGLLMGNTGGGNPYWTGGAPSDNADTYYKSYNIGYNPYNTASAPYSGNDYRTDSNGNLIGDSTKIYYVEGANFAQNATYKAKYPKDYTNGYNTEDLEFDGYDLLTHVTSGQITMGLLEGELVNGRPVYRQETVEYVANLLRGSLTIPQKAPDGDYNYNFVAGEKSASTFGTDSSGEALDLAQALRNQLGITFTAGSSRGTTPTLGSYSTTVKKADKLTGSFLDCKANITSCMDAAYYLLNNLFVTNSYNQLQDDFRYLTLSGAKSGNYPDQTVYVFDAGFTNGAQNLAGNPLSGLSQEEYKKVSQSAVEYSGYNKGGDGTIGLGPVDAKDLFYYAYDANNLSAGITTRYPFLPVVDAEGDFAGETESYYFIEDGYRSNSAEYDTYANRNFNYVLASNGEFVYHEEDNLFFEFEGDDDVYLFINDQLVLDLGGAHPISSASLKVNDYVKWAQNVLDNPTNYTEAEIKRARALDLENGEVVKFDFFYMERHGYGANMRIMTNMHITDPDMRVEKEAFQGSKKIEYGGIIDGEYPVEYNFTLNNSGNTKLYNLSFDDSDIGVKINPTDGLLVTGDDTATDSDDINGYYVTDARGERLDPQDLTAVVRGYEPVDSGGEYLLVGDEYQKVTDGSGTHNYVEVTVNFTNNAEVKNFLKTLQGDGLDNTTVDDELTQKGSGLWVDASVTIKGIYYNLTSEQKEDGMFENVVHVEATTKSDTTRTDCETLRSEDKHRVYLTAIPLFYQWADHNLFIPYQAVLDDATSEAGVKGSLLHDYKAFFDAVDGDISKIVINMSDWEGNTKANDYYDHVVRERNSKDNLLGFRTSYPEVGTYEFYVTMRLNEEAVKKADVADLNKDQYAIVRVLVIVTDVEDSTYVLDYGLKTENLDANGELFKNDELLGASSGTEAKLMGVSDGTRRVPYYRDPTEYDNYNRITFAETDLGADGKLPVKGADGTVDGYYTVNLNIPETGKKISYDKYSQTYSLTNSGTVTVHVEAPPAWETLYLYYWYDDGVNNVWPGTPMNKTSTGSSSLAIPGNVPHIIISNGTNQTINLDINPGQELWIDMSDGKLDSNGRIEAKLSYGTTDGTVHAKVPEGWGDVYIYAWDTFYNALEAWPGTKVESVDENGYFTMNIPGDITNVIVNNGDENITDNRKQTVDLSIAAGKETWINVNAVPMDNTSQPEMYTAVATQSLESVMMHATVPDFWPDAYLYYWNSNGRPTGIEWPGLKMTKNASGSYDLEVPADVENVIISDGGFRQTENLDVSAGLETWINVNVLTTAATVQSNKPDSWEELYFYFYKEGYGAVGAEWPGVQGYDLFDTGMFNANVPPYATHVVINNGKEGAESIKTKDLALCADTVNSFIVEETGQPTVLVAKVPSWWSDVRVYCYNSATSQNTSTWPGESVTPDSNGTVSFVVPDDSIDVTHVVISGEVNENGNTVRRQAPYDGGINLYEGKVNVVSITDEYGYVNYSHEGVVHATSNITRITPPSTTTTAEITYGVNAETEGFSFTPTDFMDSEYSIWLAITVHENDVTPTPLMENINIGKEVQMFKKVTVLPATVVYYEDTFAGINYSDSSQTSSVINHYSSGTGSLTQSVNQSQQYGNDNAYQSSDNSEITGGSLTDVYINDQNTFATFEFTGTGFELIGHTHATNSGVAMATIYDENGTKIKQVPVITEFDQGADHGTDSIVSVPIIRVSGLAFGKYTVKLSGVPVYDFDNWTDMTQAPPVTESYLCIDGVRIYQPISSDGVDGTHDAYIDKENGAIFTEVRNLIADKKAFAIRYSDDEGLSVSGGTNTWIENRNNVLPSDHKIKWTGKTVNSVNDYLLAGPNNEVYLLESTGEEKSAIAFYVSESEDETVHDMQIAIHAIDYNSYIGSQNTGKLYAQIQYGAVNADTDEFVWKNLTTVVSSAEQYFTIPYTECPYDEAENRYQVVLRVADADITGMASFTTLKTNGLELAQLNLSETDIVYDELHNDILDKDGNSLDSSKFINFITMSQQMSSNAVYATAASTSLNGVDVYTAFKPLVDNASNKNTTTYGSWQWTENTRLYIVSDTEPSQELIDTVNLARIQFAADGYDMSVVWGAEASATNDDIQIKYDSQYTEEEYRLGYAAAASVRAGGDRGILYGLNMMLKTFRYAKAYAEEHPSAGYTPNAISGCVLVDEPDTAERTVHLDMGRKYFTKTWIINYIREMSWMGYNALELHFSEDGGFRIDFWDNKTDFTSPTGNDFSWVCGGQKPSFNTQTDDAGYNYGQYLSSAEVKEICEVAKQYHIEIIPSFDTPAHVDWITTAYKEKGNSTFYYGGSKYTLPAVINYRGSYSAENSKCLDLGNANVQKFAFAMYTDIAAFFKEYAGSTKFNICGDEVLLSDKATDGWDYADFTDYVNSLYTILNSQGYKVRMYNDFADRQDYISKASRTPAAINSNIEIIFWDGPDSSTAEIKSASHWIDAGRNIYSGDQYWTYYVLHRMDNPDSKTWLQENGYWNMDTRNPNCTVMCYTHNDEAAVYNEWNPTMLYDYGKTAYTYSGAQLAGGYFMIWCNYAALNTEVEMWDGVADGNQFYSLRDRMWSNSIKQWNHDINSTVTFATYENLRDYFGDFPGLDTSSGGCSKPALLEGVGEGAQPVVPAYKVVFKDYDGRVISTQEVEEGMSATAPADPKRADDENYTYTFAGWDKDFTNITSDLTVTATYTEKAIIKGTARLEFALTGGSNVTMSVDDGAARPMGTYYVNETIFHGSKITLTATAAEGKKFMGWLNGSTGSLLTTDESYTFHTSGNDVLIAVYENEIEGANMVTFKNDKTKQIIDVMYYSATDEIVFPDAPTCLGYEFTGWNLTEAEIQAKLAQGKAVTVLPLWEVKDKFVSVDVTGGEIIKYAYTNDAGEYVAYKAITVDAYSAPAGMMFSHWEDANGRIVSYDSTYKFYPTEDTVLTAICVSKNGMSLDIVDKFVVDETGEGKKTVYFVNNWNWTDVSVHYWGAEGTDWPGASMTLLDEKSADGYDVYSYVLPAGTTGIIFNGTKADGSGLDQTPNITEFADGDRFRMAWNNGNLAVLDEVKTIRVSVPNNATDKVFGAYVWNSANENEWIVLADKMSDNLYTVTIPAKYTNVIIASLADEEKPASWDNVGTQSVDLSLTAENNYYHMFVELDNGKYTGQWSKMTTVYFRNDKNWSNIRVDYTTGMGTEQDVTSESIFVDMETGEDNLFAILVPQNIKSIAFANSDNEKGTAYAFAVTDVDELENSIFSLVTGGSASIDYQVLTNLYVDTNKADENTIVYSWSVPEGSDYTFVNAGLLLVEDAYYVESGFNTTTLNSNIITFTPAKKYQTETGVHSLTHKVASDSNWKVKVFVQYRDEAGVLRTAYSDTVTAKR